MSLIDFVIVIVIIAGVTLGWMRGFIKQIASVAAFLGAILLTRLFGDAAESIIKAIIPELSTMSGGEWVAAFLGRAVLFIFVYLSIELLGGTIRSILKGLSLGAFEKIGGSIICTLKYLIFLSLLLNLWHAISPTSSIFTSSKILDGVLLKFTFNLGPWLLDSPLVPLAKETLQSVTG